MPYLNKDLRECIERYGELDLLEGYVNSLEDDEWAGAVNYVNYRILKKRMEREGVKRYWRLALWVGTMVCCILEVYRRLIAKYEDEAIRKNGDVE